MPESIAAPDILQLLATLERRALETATPPAGPLWGQLERIPWVRVLGLARFWEAPAAPDFAQCVSDWVTGLSGLGQPLLFALIGGPRGVQIYVGIEDLDAEALLRASLAAAFPGILLEECAALTLGSSLESLGYFNHQGRLTGIPDLKNMPGSDSRSRASVPQVTVSAVQPRLERLMRGLYGCNWGYFVRATPLSAREALQRSEIYLAQLSAISGMVDWQQSKQAQELQTVGPNRQRSESESLNRTVTDYRARRCRDLLERQAARYQIGQAQGLWTVDVHCFTPDATTLGTLRALLGAVFAGPESSPEPLRTFVSRADSRTAPEDFCTVLHSGELAGLVQLPAQEFPGYRVTPYAPFDTDPLPAEAGQAINIGKILDGGRPTGNWFLVPQQDFVKHGLVVGVTGSGKTNTLFYILDKCWRQGIPFLVVEPAKSEYRDLRAVAGMESLQVFTLGDETVAPLRLNPFEFEMGPAGRIHVQTHIDYLKSVFNAAFILYAPMPYVLETCLHEVYQDQGWDLTMGLNHRLSPELHVTAAQSWPIFPTLSDLYRKIEVVVERLGYEERIKMDVRAGLQTRVGSLMLGSKGLMLDTPHSLPMGHLLSHPTVLELERIGNDDEKAFVIGLLLMRLYEYRRLQSQGGAAGMNLQHIAVFEEAHRLLKNVPTQVETEAANVKGQAVEVFTNMLSEIRAYGQGVLIAEQIPTKLASDAIKNTNLKLLHRIVAADDRAIMGGTMNLDEPQQRFVASLPTGRAAAYAEGADGPYLVEIPNFKRRLESQRASDRMIAETMQSVVQTALYDPAPGYCDTIERVAGRFDSGLHDDALDILRHPDFSRTWACYTLSALLSPSQVIQGYRNLLTLQRGLTGGLGSNREQQIMLALLLHAAAEHFAARGRQYNWAYPVAEELRVSFVAVLAPVVKQYSANEDLPTCLSDAALSVWQAYAAQYQQQVRREVGPFAACVHCNRRCLYRYEVALWVSDRVMVRDFSTIMRDTRNDLEMWKQLTQIAERAAQQLLVGVDASAISEAALCFATQMGVRLGLSSVNQLKLVSNISRVLTHRGA